MSIHRLTLDTNVPFRLWDREKQPTRTRAVQELVGLNQAGRVELFVTARIRDDIPDDPMASELTSRLNESGILEVGTVFRWDHSRWGRDKWADEDFSNAYQAFQKRAQQRASRGKKHVLDWRDWDHLQTHYLDKRDFFLTWDPDILNLREELLRDYGLVVQTPEEYLTAYFNFGQP